MKQITFDGRTADKYGTEFVNCLASAVVRVEDYFGVSGHKLDRQQAFGNTGYGKTRWVEYLFNLLTEHGESVLTVALRFDYSMASDESEEWCTGLQIEIGDVAADSEFARSVSTVFEESIRASVRIIEGKEENPLNLPPESLRQADAIFTAFAQNPEILETLRAYGLRFGISPLGAVLLSERYGDAGRRAAPNLVGLDSVRIATRFLYPIRKAGA
jgi:hypothetical protein